VGKEQKTLFDAYEGVTDSSEEETLVKMEITLEDDKQSQKLKKLFNSRMKAIQKLRQDLKGLEVIFRELSDLYHKEVRPEELRLNDRRILLMHALDKAFQKKSFTKSEKDFLLEEILGHRNMLLQDQQTYDLRAFDKYDAIVENEILQDDLNILNDFVEEITGVEGIDINDVLGDKKLSEEEFADKYFKDENPDNDDTTDEDIPMQPAHGMGKHTGDDFEAHFMKTYKQLAKRVHPDLEQDPVVKENKEALMKELAVAKDHKDLFQLISLKDKIDRIELGRNQWDERFLKQYVAYLLEEKKTLEVDIWKLKNYAGMKSWLYQNFYHRTQKGKQKKIDRYNEDCLDQLKQMEILMIDLKTVKGTKKYIRDVFAYQEAPDFFFFDD
jgi:hypothetical protein